MIITKKKVQQGVPGHLTSIKKEFGCCTRRLSLHRRLSSAGLGCNKSFASCRHKKSCVNENCGISTRRIMRGIKRQPGESRTEFPQIVRQKLTGMFDSQSGKTCSQFVCFTRKELAKRVCTRALPIAERYTSVDRSYRESYRPLSHSTAGRCQLNGFCCCFAHFFFFFHISVF